MAFSLAKLKCNPPAKPKSIYFPIFENESDFNAKKYIFDHNFIPPVVDLLRRIQPFQRADPNVEGKPENDPLIVLNLINNTDKHRISISADLSTKRLEKNVILRFATQEDAALNCPPNVIIYGTRPGLILEYKTNKPVELMHLHFKLDTSLIIIFDDKQEEFPSVLNWLYSYINRVINEFRQFFKC